MMRASILSAVVLVSFGASFSAAELRPETLDAWESYIALTEERIEEEFSSDRGFLVMDFLDASDGSRCRRDVRAGKICIVKLESLDAEGRSVEVPSGMIHHWYGAVLVPGADLESVVEFVSTYDGRESYYEEVEDSRLLSREGDTYRIFLRLKREKVLTVHYNTEHEVTYRRHGPGRVSSRSIATRIREIDDPGGARETERREGEDRGFLWRLRSYWRFQEVEEGTFVECESVSLSRDVHDAVQWLVKDFIDSVPRESLESTLAPIPRALAVTPNRSDRR